MGKFTRAVVPYGSGGTTQDRVPYVLPGNHQHPRHNPFYVPPVVEEEEEEVEIIEVELTEVIDGDVDVV